MSDAQASGAPSGHRVFHDGELQAQRLFGVEDEAHATSEIVHDRLGVGQRRLVESMRFFFLTAASTDGGLVVCDVVGRLHDAAGEELPLVRVASNGKTLAFALPPHSDADAAIPSAARWSAGLLFVDVLRHGARYRINGWARTLQPGDERLAGVWPPSCRIVEVDVRQAYANCTQRVVKMEPG